MIRSESLQTTLANKVSCSGIGLHGGRRVHLAIYPAEADTGILFRRLDVPAVQAMVSARFDAVCESRLGTTIRNAHGTEVATVEHLMAALWGMGVDNAVVTLDGPEVPIMDGSSEPFVFMLECAGIVSLSAPRRLLQVTRSVEVREGNSIARIEPNREGEEGMSLGIQIDFTNKLIGRQTAHYDFSETTFKQTLARARTFGFEHEVEAMHKMGLALGGSLENAVVVGQERILNEEGLRYRDEFVRHKALDCLGDLYLAGYRIEGRFTFVRPGHAINNQLLRALFADEHAYIVTSQPEPVFFSREAVPAYA
ncbi:MAG: UDP-3-O-acyl-N-acetylglucosamine deacetylase [Pseudomonadota bacterium]|nr:UDP-3-O-acyl-N-acetylglucosamine deacetylase [Pseudomonadota bacterium]